MRLSRTWLLSSFSSAVTRRGVRAGVPRRMEFGSWGSYACAANMGCYGRRRQAWCRSRTTACEDGDAERHAKVYRLQGESMTDNQSGVTITTDTGHVLQSDLPRRMGGKDSAPQPVETLLAAWMGCTQATALFVGRQMKPERLLLDRLVFDVKGVRDERGALALPMEADPPVPSRLLEVRGQITVYQAGGTAIARDKMSLLQEQTEKRCPIANMMIASGCVMNVAWVDGACSDEQVAEE